MSYAEMAWLAAPEIIVSIGAFAVLAIDLFAVGEAGNRTRMGICSAFASAACAGAAAWTFAFPESGQTPWGMLEMNGLTQTLKVCILFLTILSLWVNEGRKMTEHVGEYVALTLLSAAGMMLLVSSRDLLMIFVSLELSTVPLYVLAAFDKRSGAGARAALRFFLLGSVSAAVTLFGFSFLYGFAGGTSIREVAAAAALRPTDPLLGLGAALVLGGVGFKIAAAPFHLWAPGVYTEAPVPAAAFISSASKVAGVAVLAVLFIKALNSGNSQFLWSRSSGTSGILAMAALFTMIVGTLAAIVQKDLRGLLAYSAVGNAGYMLLGLLTKEAPAQAAVAYYAVTYGIATLGAFGVVASAGRGPGCPLDRLAGLSADSPAVAVCLLVFMLSLAGIPPLGGFFGKVYVFTALLKPDPMDWGRLVMLLVALAASAVSLYYYLRVLKLAFVAEKASATPGISVPLQLVLIAAALSVVLLGLFPEVLIGALLRGIQ